MHIAMPILLQGRIVRLELLSSVHAPDLFAAAQDDELWRYMPIARPAGVDALRAWIDDTLQLTASGSIIPFAIIDQASGRAIGSTRYMEIVRGDRGLEIGWTWLGRSYWRTAVNSECKYLLLRHGFEALGAIRMQLKTDLRNLRSQQAIARLGAVREGVLRNHRILPDGYRRASVVFSILDDEWPAVKTRLEMSGVVPL